MRAGRPARAGRAAAALAAAALLAGAAGAERAPESELRELRRAIEARREAVAAFERRQRGLFEALEAVERTVAALREDAARARREATEARERARALEARAEELGEALARTRRRLAARAVALYKQGPVGPVRLLFAPGSVRERLARIELLRRVVERDQALLDRRREQARELARAQREATRAAEARDAAVARLERRARALAEERRRKRGLLAKVRSDRTRARAALNELEAAASALEAKLDHLRDAAPAPAAPAARGDDFAARRGRLGPPVDGPITRPFGRTLDREFRTETFRRGVDFAVERGEPVRAVAPGVVRFAGWFRGYGKLVIVEHGRGHFTVFGHLDALDVEVGDAVEEGGVIGAAGDTGSLSGPRLYFEIRRGGRALDPSDWLGPVAGS